MFWLIENNSQLKQFYNKGHDEAFIEPIYLSDYSHPKLTSLSLLYIHPVRSRKGFIISIDHTEATSVAKTHILSLLKTFDKIYTLNQKSLLYHFPINNLVDISFNHIIKPETTNAHTFLYEQYPNKLDINKIIPIGKHYEKCENIYKQIKNYCYEENKFYSKLSKVFYAIETNGIALHRKSFDKYFELPNDVFNIYSDRIYTSYNLHTTTGRPSNSFNTINFAALNKENHCRKSFIPKNNTFIEFDISAYHPTLASQLVGFKSTNIYQELADIANINVGEAKELMFQQLYGGIREEYKHWEFFQKVDEYINSLWNQWKTNGYIECPISKHKFHVKQIENVNPQKLFNYLLQNQETSNNVNMVWEILKILKGKNTKLVLYTYDAFLFDVDNEEQDVIENIKQIFANYKLNVKAKTGNNYDF
jgi:hypothetical protein